MRIHNETKWTNRSLKKFLVAGCRAAGLSSTGVYRIIYTRQHRGISGYGYYHARSLCLRIPRVWDMADTGHMKRLAQVLIHELDHNKGLHHVDMVDSSTLSVPWVEGLTLEEKVVKPKEKKDRLAIRVTQAEKNLARYREQATKMQNLVKRWEKRLKQAVQAVQARDRRQSRLMETGEAIKKAASPPEKSLSSKIQQEVQRVQGCCKIEVGVRESTSGGLTPDVHSWVIDADLGGTVPLNQVKIEDGMKLDLYLSKNGDFVGNVTVIVENGIPTVSY